MKPRFEKVALRPDSSFQARQLTLPRFDAPWHHHPEIELTLILESTGRRFVGDSVERFGPGDLVLLGSQLPHFWHNLTAQTGGRRARSVVVQFLPDLLGPPHFAGPEFAAIRRLIERSSRGLVFSGRAAARLAQRLEVLPNLDGLPALLELLALLDLLAATRARPLASASYAPRIDAATETRLGRVYAFLQEHFHEPLTLAEMARVAAMTPAAFSRFFKRASGSNVSVFLNDLRIDHACRHLQESDRPTATIALECGFNTLSSFNRQFRERKHCSPRDYRRQTQRPAGAVAS